MVLSTPLNDFGRKVISSLVAGDKPAQGGEIIGSRSHKQVEVKLGLEQKMLDDCPRSH